MANKKFQRISKKITLTMARWLILMTGLVTGASYLHIRSIVKALISERLEMQVSVLGALKRKAV